MSTRNSTSIAAARSLATVKHAPPAFSQEATRKSGEEIETVVVPGIRPRKSQTVVDVLTVEDVAKLPQRVSGVSISREFGKGERVSMRVD